MKIIGLTGGSGSGKAAICEILAGKGAYIVNTDKIAHEIILKGKPAYDEILLCFGAGFLDENGEIIRRRLSELVFSDKSKLDKLTEITHKYIIEQSVNEINEIRTQGKGYSFIVIDAPLLIEANMQTICDMVWVVHAKTDKRIERIINRDNINEQQALLRISRQMPFEQLKQYADVLIENNGTIAELESKIERLVKDVLCI